MITHLYVAGELAPDMLEAIRSAEHAVVDACGGLTMLPAYGAWKDAAGKVVIEPVRVYEVLWPAKFPGSEEFGPEALAVDRFAQEVRRIFNQDEVLRVDVQETSIRRYRR